MGAFYLGEGVAEMSIVCFGLVNKMFPSVHQFFCV